MTNAALRALGIEQLVDRFEANCMAQDEADLYSDIGRYNKLYLKMIAIEDELKSRPGDQRRALTALYNHPNAQVRLQAARISFALAPDAARRTIEEISEGKKEPQAGDARMTLRNLERGIFKPT